MDLSTQTSNLKPGWKTVAGETDPLFFTILNTHNQPIGIASYLRINPASGSIEVGHIHFSPTLQRTPAATEAMYLMMQYAFELGYRRYEWKCDALNNRSRRAALRLGLSFEGVFRQATVYKSRNRDTAWFAAIDSEWPTLKVAFETWLKKDNFGHDGTQHLSLSTLTAPILSSKIESSD
jgi:RimJ/RimL family protein N-acetyltransferase